ncbi:signal peptidase I SipW [Thalassobacillus pellis]|uniref:signal peptidase I SipW n=1 Tax=Thalassobacillus pellis TaxID=748008 RepID=UPI0019615D53|nr:signal peptidase I [Thalassobacillus pellis]MBM7553664.1 signal peptidase [Thalassobacillus pellis]
MKIVKKTLNYIATTLLAILLLFMVFMVISSKASPEGPNILGYQLKTVLSGSMEPGIKTGSIIAVEPLDNVNTIKKGDVITYKEEDYLVTHRVTEVVSNEGQTLFRTKGDNNDAEDLNPVMAENVVAQYTGFTVPYVGYFIEYAKSKTGSALLLLIPGLLLLGYSGFTIWQVISSIETPSRKEEESSEPTKS